MLVINSVIMIQQPLHWASGFCSASLQSILCSNQSEPFKMSMTKRLKNHRKQTQRVDLV